MAQLKVKHNGKIIHDIVLNEKKSYLGGRKEDCDIPLLAEKTISREHFRLSFHQNQWVLEVLSRFGEVLFQNDKVQNLILDQSNIFHIPPYEFAFTRESPAQVGASFPSNEISSITDNGDFNEDRTFVGKLTQIPFIKVINNDDKSFQLLRLEGGDIWLAGRDPSSAIPIKDQRVSRRQFEIRKTEGIYGIIDLGSVNGTLVNGNNISTTEVTPLRSGDAITVLDNIFYFELHDPRFAERVQTVDYDKISRTLTESSSMSLPDSQSETYPMVDPSVYGKDPYAPSVEGEFPEVAPETLLSKLKEKKLRVVIGVLALLLVVGALMEGDPSSKSNSNHTDLNGNPNDPYNKLKKEQQIFIKQSFQLAQSYYDSDNSELCRAELSKIREVMPDYKKSYWGKDIGNLDQSAEQKIYLLSKQKEFEAKEKMMAEQEVKVQEIVALCKSKLNPQMTRDEFDSCISPSVTANPHHPLLVSLRVAFDQIEMTRTQKDLEKKEYQEQAEKLQYLFMLAEKTEKNGNFVEAIDAYRKVVSSKYVDPNALKPRAQRSISSLKSKMGVKTSSLISEAEKLVQAKKYKQAILNLRMARKVNPQGDEINDKIELYIKELRKEMKALWDEAVIEESFGKVMPDENNTGAVGKWKKIIDQDIPDGDFYQKAFIKLKKYGAN